MPKTPVAAARASAEIFLICDRLVQGDDRAGEAGGGDGFEAGGSDFVAHLFFSGKGADRMIQIIVCGAVAGDPSGETRENPAEVEVVKRAHEAGGLGEFEDEEGASRAEDSFHFLKSAMAVGEVSKSEGDCDEIGGMVGKREIQDIALKEFDFCELRTGVFF